MSYGSKQLKLGQEAKSRHGSDGRRFAKKSLSKWRRLQEKKNLENAPTKNRFISYW